MAGYDLIVCGGGVIGLSIAFECASHGWRVLVLESNAVGRGSSWAGAGILPAGATRETLDPIEQLRSLSHLLHPEWATRLSKLSGIDNEFRQCGGLYLATSPGERATLLANELWWSEHGIEFERWNADDIRERVPQIANDATTNLVGWFVPSDGRLRNPRHLQALVASCVALGVDIRENASVASFETAIQSIQCVRTSNEAFTAERYLIANGAWASQLLSGLNVETGILPVRGQMLLYRCKEMLFPMVINDGHRYLVPRDDGHLLAGSCEEEVGFQCATTSEMLDQIRTWAESIMPALRDTPIEGSWAGLRPGSFDSFPYLSTLHPYQNAYIAAGHFRHGLHWSTATALLMYQLMSGSPTEIDIEPFRIQRGNTLSNSFKRL